MSPSDRPCALVFGRTVLLGVVAALVLPSCRSVQPPSRPDPGAPVGAMQSAALHRLPVRVFVDQYVGASPDAARAVVAATEGAGPILARAAGIRLEVSGPHTLEQPGRGWDLNGLLDHLARRAPDPGEGVAVWFCRSDRIWDFHGLASGFGDRWIAIAAQQRDGPVAVSPVVVAHEIAHLFGAVHTTAPGSFMSDGKVLGREVDAANREILAATHAIDFRGGVASLDDDLLARVAELSRDPSLVTAWDPVGSSLRRASRAAADDGDLALAVRLLERCREVAPHGSSGRDAAGFRWLGHLADRRGDAELAARCRASADALREGRAAR